MKMELYEERAFDAYYKRANKTGLAVIAPSRTANMFEEDGISYLVLSNVNGPLAIYKIDWNNQSIRYVKSPKIWKIAEEM